MSIPSYQEEFSANSEQSNTIASDNSTIPDYKSAFTEPLDPLPQNEFESAYKEYLPFTDQYDPNKKPVEKSWLQVKQDEYRQERKNDPQKLNAFLGGLKYSAETLANGILDTVVKIDPSFITDTSLPGKIATLQKDSAARAAESVQGQQGSFDTGVLVGQAAKMIPTMAASTLTGGIAAAGGIAALDYEDDLNRRLYNGIKAIGLSAVTAAGLAALPYGAQIAGGAWQALKGTGKFADEVTANILNSTKKGLEHATSKDFWHGIKSAFNQRAVTSENNYIATGKLADDMGITINYNGKTYNYVEAEKQIRRLKTAEANINKSKTADIAKADEYGVQADELREAVDNAITKSSVYYPSQADILADQYLKTKQYFKDEYLPFLNLKSKGAETLPTLINKISTASPKVAGELEDLAETTFLTGFMKNLKGKSSYRQANALLDDQTQQIAVAAHINALKKAMNQNGVVRLDEYSAQLAKTLKDTIPGSSPMADKVAVLGKMIEARNQAQLKGFTNWDALATMGVGGSVGALVGGPAGALLGVGVGAITRAAPKWLALNRAMQDPTIAQIWDTYSRISAKTSPVVAAALENRLQRRLDVFLRDK